MIPDFIDVPLRGEIRLPRDDEEGAASLVAPYNVRPASDLQVLRILYAQRLVPKNAVDEGASFVDHISTRYPPVMGDGRVGPWGVYERYMLQQFVRIAHMECIEAQCNPWVISDLPEG